MPFGFSARPVQIATCNFPPRSCDLFTLPPHAPCRLQRFLCRNFLFQPPLPPHAPCRLQPFYNLDHDTAFDFASTRSVQIATGVTLRSPFAIRLCLHTLRADCNSADDVECLLQHALPPHAPCRLQQNDDWSSGKYISLPPHAPCRLQHDIVDILEQRMELCLHTLRADCNTC